MVGRMLRSAAIFVSRAALRLGGIAVATGLAWSLWEFGPAGKPTSATDTEILVGVAIFAFAVFAAILCQSSLNATRSAWDGKVAGEWAVALDGLIWTLWSTLAITACFSAGASIWAAAVSAGGQGEEASPSLPRSYLAAVAIVITAVTGFYLSLLHRAQDYAQRTAADVRREAADLQAVLEARSAEMKDLSAKAVAKSETAQAVANQQAAHARSISEELSRLLGTRSSIYEVMAGRFVELESRVVLPLIQQVQALWRRNGMPLADHKLAKLDDDWAERVRVIHAELALFGLAQASTPADFIGRWSTARAFDAQLSEPQFMDSLRLAGENLELLAGNVDEVERRELEKIRRELLRYEQRSAAH